MLKSHREDGGRYIGTGCTFLNRDPETGYVNMGTYRMQVHERNLLGIWQSPGQQGRLIAERYWKQGKACPVVATFGGDPLLFFLSHTKFPFGISELDRAGGMLGAPVEVIKGPITGLPIPAHAEIAIEGEMPPPEVESRLEGPFGEWPGYYTVGSKGTADHQPVIRVKAIYYRNEPILLNMAPQWPGAPHHAVRFEGGILWQQLEAAGVPGIVGTYVHHMFLVVVAIKQQYAGHAKQAGMAVLGCSASARNGRFVVIVDEDIDPSNMDEVMWAMTTRVDPATDIEIIHELLGDPARSAHAARAGRQRPAHQLARHLLRGAPMGLEGQVPPGQPHRQGPARRHGEEVRRPAAVPAAVGSSPSPDRAQRSAECGGTAAPAISSSRDGA